ncbi:MAG: hypothetical protein NTY53_20730, partial [Kiritimatiellaeota bacterium]|nr:hypothetical protein [Kiritimatiellota bacterium]
MKASLPRACVVTALALGSLMACAESGLRLVDGDHVAAVWVAPGESTTVQLAARDLVRDIAEVTGQQPALLQTGAPPVGAILIGTV